MLKIRRLLNLIMFYFQIKRNVLLVTENNWKEAKALSELRSKILYEAVSIYKFCLVTMEMFV